MGGGDASFDAEGKYFVECEKCDEKIYNFSDYADQNFLCAECDAECKSCVECGYKIICNSANACQLKCWLCNDKKPCLTCLTAR
jgi:hypothetical protein